MKFKLEIDMGNAAFEDNNNVNEVQRVLDTLAERIDLFNRFKVGHNGGLMDINGNKVGTWEVTE